MIIMKKSYSYIGISFIILVFGIWAVPKILDRLSSPDLIYIERNGEKAKVPDFSFIDQNGNTITNQDYEGKVYVVEFFFTTCPDICIQMNENMVKIQDEFFGNPKVGIASFTIDPAYDTPEVLKNYAKENGITKLQWHLLTGDREDIFKLANEGFNLYVAAAADGDRNFEHSGFFALIDQEGYIRSRIDEHDNPLVYYDGLEIKQIQMLKEDIRKLL